MFRKKKPKNRPIAPHLRQRVHSLSGPDLFVSLDSVLMGLGILLDEYRYHDAPGLEVSEGIDAFHALWDEVLTRESSNNSAF